MNRDESSLNELDAILEIDSQFYLPEQTFQSFLCSRVQLTSNSFFAETTTERRNEGREEKRLGSRNLELSEERSLKFARTLSREHSLVSLSLFLFPSLHFYPQIYILLPVLTPRVNSTFSHSFTFPLGNSPRTVSHSFFITSHILVMGWSSRSLTKFRSELEQIHARFNLCLYSQAVELRSWKKVSLQSLILSLS